MPGTDEITRRRIREELDRSFFVEAAAGTGKTSELIHRVVASIGSGRARAEGTVILTFTRKAAGEIKLRLRQGLEQGLSLASSPETRARLEAAIARLEDARVGTIHAFAQELLRERPVEARLDPEFETLEETEALTLFRQVFQDWFQRRLSAPPPGLRRSLHREPPAYGGGRGTMDRLVDAAWQVASFRDFDAPWPTEPWDRDEALRAFLRRAELFLQHLDRAGRPRDPLVRSLEPLRRVLEWSSRAAELGTLDLDAAEARLVAATSELRYAREKRGRGGFFDDAPSSRGDLVAERDRLLDAFEAFVARANADLVTHLRNELYEVVLAYEAKKAELGKLDFTDLLLETRDLLVERPEVLGAFQRRFDRIYVDEVQDTDPLQMEILLLLAGDDPRPESWRLVTPRPGKLFMVGDPKQSIYGFRRADLGVYQTVKAQLGARGVEALTLSRSFRSTAALQAFINHCFAPAMVEDPARGQPGYVPLEGGPEGEAVPPPIVALAISNPDEEHPPRRSQIARRLPDLVAGWLEWLLRSSGWRVRDPSGSGERVPVRPNHVALLFRRYAQGAHDTTAPYLRALEARGLPHLVIGARAFHDQEEVEMLRSALVAIEWPDDERAVFATLRGALFAVPDEALFLYREATGGLQPLEVSTGSAPPELGLVAETLRLLATLHQRRNERSIVETITELLEATRAHAGLALRPAGARALSNLQRLLDLASDFERRGGLSFRGFVERLEESASRSNAVEAPVVEESAEGIRVITAHSAKGLEFPVVVLADLDAGAEHRSPSRHLDAEGRRASLRLLGFAPTLLQAHSEVEAERERAEELRLAYVAASRARDVLVVPAIETGPYASWFSSLNRGLYPAPERWSAPARAPGCPEFQPAPRPGASAPVVSPGLHSIGEIPVVWWDPAQLRLAAPPRLGLRAQDLLRERAETEDDTRVQRERWRAEVELALARGSTASLRPFIATQAEWAAPGPAVAVEVQTVPRPAHRPSGPRFGTLVHSVLRDLDLASPTGTIRGLAELCGRTLGASEAEVHAAADAVTAALAHPVMREAARAKDLARELPVLLHRPDGSMLEGEIDLCFTGEDGAWVLVDFKTDQDPSLRLEKYERQLSWYAAGLRAKAERPIRALILVV